MTARLATFAFFSPLVLTAFGALVGVVYRWDAILTNMGL